MSRPPRPRAPAWAEAARLRRADPLPATPCPRHCAEPDPARVVSAEPSGAHARAADTGTGRRTGHREQGWQVKWSQTIATRSIRARRGGADTTRTPYFVVSRQLAGRDHTHMRPRKERWVLVTRGGKHQLSKQHAQTHGRGTPWWGCPPPRKAHPSLSGLRHSGSQAACSWASPLGSTSVCVTRAHPPAPQVQAASACPAAHLACESGAPTSSVVLEPRKPDPHLTQSFPSTDKSISSQTPFLQRTLIHETLKSDVTTSRKPSYTSVGVLLSLEPPH